MPDITDDMEVMTETAVMLPSSPKSLFPQVSSIASSHFSSSSPTRPTPSPLPASCSETSVLLSPPPSGDESRSCSVRAKPLDDKDRKSGDSDTKEDDIKMAEEGDDRCAATDDGDNYIDVIGDSDDSDDEMTDDHKPTAEIDDSSKNSVDDDHNGGSSISSSGSNYHIHSDDSANDRDDDHHPHQHHHHHNPSPLSHTNFSIAAILKPDFGVRKGGVRSGLVASNNENPRYYQHFNQSPSFRLPGHRYTTNNNSHHHHNHAHRYHHHHQLQQHQHQMARVRSPSPVDLTTRGRGEAVHGKDKIRNKEAASNGCNSNRHTKDNCSDSSGSRSVSSKSTKSGNERGGKADPEKFNLWPAWVFCTRYSDRPSSGECVTPVLTSVIVQQLQQQWWSCAVFIFTRKL